MESKAWYKYFLPINISQSIFKFDYVFNIKISPFSKFCIYYGLRIFANCEDWIVICHNDPILLRERVICIIYLKYYVSFLKLV